MAVHSKEKAPDSVPWVVKDTSGKKVGTDTYNSFSEANTAARSFTRESGTYAQAVRS